MLIQNYLLNAVELYPGKEVIVHAGKRATYAEIYQEAMALANWLHSKDFQPGFRGAILTDDPFEYITSYFAILMAKGIVVGLNNQTSHRSLATVLTDSGASVIFNSAKFVKYLDKIATYIPDLKVAVVGGSLKNPPSSICFEWLERTHAITATRKKNYKSTGLSPSSIAQIIYTSGTTGPPKGVMLRHSNIVSNTGSIVNYLKLTDKDKGMAVLPFFYSYGSSIFLSHIAAAATLIVNQSFLYPNVILDEMVQEKATGISGVPSTFAILLNRSAIKNYQFPDLRYITQAGAAMAPRMVKQLQELLPTVDIYIMYGQTEASARLSYLDPMNIGNKPGSIGKAIPGVTLKLLDTAGNSVSGGEVGEIVACGDNIMAGYWRKPDETAKVIRQGELWTGDFATMDQDGDFYIVSRKSDMIKSGAHRIGPNEIEEIIHEHEEIYEVAVVGVKDDILGEAIKAYVVLKEHSTCTTRELIKHCRKNLPAYKVPQHIEFLDELPKTSMGKIKKRVLRNKY